MTAAAPRAEEARLADAVLGPVWRGGRFFAPAFALTGLGTIVFFLLISYTVVRGIGVWGNNIPAAWAFAIVNFVFWIGIGHAGTFISAILYLFEQRWRSSVNRFAEAMTLFAVAQAALFPVLHLGRPWFAYWLFPYPATMAVWPQVKSPLPWDAAAVSTYGTVSLLFFYLGLLPDLAAVRDAAPERWRRRVYGVFALGFRGSEATWRHYRRAYLLLAGLATPLVLSVHSVVSSDFAVGLTPGWHSTIFPPYFVAGAIFSGLAMVLTLLIPARRAFHFEDIVTRADIDRCAKLLLVTGLCVDYGYLVEYFLAWYSGDPAEIGQFFDARPRGPNAALFYLMVLGNVLAPQALWSARLRKNLWLLFVISLLVNVGMWSERFVIVVMSLEREFLSAAWADYAPTYVDFGILAGSFCCFLLLFLGFLRFLPSVALSEVKEARHAGARGRGGE
ncbi:MAG TPA: NrfD/PsrC family molybdoenzyme membrane anchor subunit [Polyangiaceae bacterium]|nr:NrfD/PsrC family molybdoenzyme membrane anchor subunit [Polyangiaceae bacterium]